MSDKRNKIQIKADGLQRLLMLRYCSEKLNLLLVTEYPKSGGTWLSQMLSEVLQLPFPRNKRPKLESCIMQAHLLYHPNYSNVVCLVRDGRDVVISAYYHYFFENEHNIPWAVQMYRNKLKFESYENIEKNLPQFIEFLFTKEKFSWSEFVNSWNNKNVILVKYEELLSDCSQTLTKIVNNLPNHKASIEEINEIVAKFSFQNMKLKHNTNGISFLRNGKSGDWKNHFSQESKIIFNRYAGKELIALGYEKSNNWVNE